eukprot:5234364-Prymnesium_polylepis.1
MRTARATAAAAAARATATATGRRRSRTRWRAGCRRGGSRQPTRRAGSSTFTTRSRAARSGRGRTRIERGLRRFDVERTTRGSRCTAGSGACVCGLPRAQRTRPPPSQELWRRPASIRPT